MDTQLYVNLPGETAAASTSLVKICRRASWIATTALLMGGITMISYGINTLARELLSASVRVETSFDFEVWQVREKVVLDVDTNAVYRNGIIVVTGILATVLSAGILLGMTCQRCY